ncbi:MAG TPA: class II aldolase/adducin family protein [Candidatus Agrococcus pullicola]|uniref:Class II aldolase/adducin family protein n=1 Tax=Candidatus Agrococcus pullicola TaxID=2838429 RepID=A0A9D1YXM1_9MICO|nr:class II aldolase/adducin family protein [Candidatus Agrococcus pullicola]
MTDIDALLELAHAAGEPRRGLAILGEGNVSARTGEARMLVKASGSNLGASTPADIVECELAPILALLDDDGADDEAVGRVLLKSRVDQAAKRPSVEAMLHAVVIDAGAGAACHTHPESANGILCSSKADYLVRGALFPDQIVVLGQRGLLIPYVDPGLELARTVRRELAEFTRLHGQLPKIVYMQNHGIFAIGEDPAECLRITEMADKFAKILTAALAVGEPRFLPESVLDRIENRDDEHYRRRMLKEGR